MYYNYRDGLKQNSRDLRKNMTKEESKLWYQFLNKLSVRFHRQKMVGSYILDFYCASHKLAIELDGSQHYDESEVIYDNKRSEYLASLGIDVVRYSNRDVNTNFESVCSDIINRLDILL